jgi:hypothetical protein
MQSVKMVKNSPNKTETKVVIYTSLRKLDFMRTLGVFDTLSKMQLKHSQKKSFSFMIC